MQALNRSPFSANAITAVGAVSQPPRPRAEGTRAFAEDAHALLGRLRRSHADATARIHPTSLPELLQCTPRGRGVGGGPPPEIGAGLRCGAGEDEVVLDADGWYIAVNVSTGTARLNRCPQ